MKIYIEHSIDTGHRIVGHEGKCARLHGHTYRFEIWLESLSLIDPGFVVDFGHVKDILNEWDHRTLIWDDDPLHVHLRDIIGVIFVPWNPTAERMAGYTRQRIFDEFPQVTTAKVRVWETPKCYAESS
jgi:6-pyruvoyltetrahydropterin/6-carboxytetrahydropterin synthase